MNWRTHDKLRRVVNVYRAAAEMGEAPTKAVAQAFNVSRSAAANLVARARAAGMLPPTSQGRATRGFKRSA